MIQITEDQLRVIINEAIIAGERREQGLLSDDEMDELVVVQIEAVKSLQPHSIPGDMEIPGVKDGFYVNADGDPIY